MEQRAKAAGKTSAAQVYRRYINANKNPLENLKSVDLSHLSKEEAKEFTLLLEELEKREKRESSMASFYDFVKTIWPEFIAGAHHKRWPRLSTRLLQESQKD